ncbi:MAG: VanW family protein [Bacillota bacterium]
MNFCRSIKTGYRQKLILLLLVFLQFVFGIGGGIFAAGIYHTRSNRIFPGVEISGIRLEGLTQAQAMALLDSRLNLPPAIILVYEEHQFEIPLDPATSRYLLDELIAGAVGINVFARDDFQFFNLISWFPHPYPLIPAMTASPSDIDNGLLIVKNKIDREPEDARIVIENGVPRVLAEQWGLSLEVEASREVVLESLAMGITGNIPLQVTRVQPEISREQLPDFSHMLACSSTPLADSEPDRRHNIVLATEMLNALHIEPGEVFSFNEILGAATEEKGFRKVRVISNREFVPGMGGGICQVSTTIYQAALKAELEIVQRSPHSRPVFYVPLGQDATISYDLLDLKIRNNRRFPIMLVGKADELFLQFSFYGAERDWSRRVEISSEDIEVLPPKLLERPDPNLPMGTRQLVREGEEGYKVNVYRVIYIKDLKIAKELISTDFYMPVNEVVKVGKKQVSPEIK